MIEVSRYDGGITVTGHAGYAERGKDIVCAGVSTLVQTLIQSFEELTADTIQYDMQPGTVHIKHGNLLGYGAALVSSFFIGIKLIADKYPKHVKLTDHRSR